MHNFKELKVWQKARVFVKEVYEMTSAFPPVEMYGITSQVRRAAVSVSGNIAEGAGKRSEKEFMHFLDTAYSSALEIENLILLSFDLHYINDSRQIEMLEHIAEIQKMLTGLIGSIRSRTAMPSPSS